ncbi:PLP-dependent aminotransferase family protein [Methylotenera sp.]|jgi:DNA-binding transcriptional MocR family regulator|uniref:aminotransferase-like domain-containing protein n=1 Tax=Methylotenera sp. TaxID=2051956 RepID=UPI0027337B3F|nr:PLP-dependent aminotransferase family protein [Methylotenera sp.]MDP3777674.1 PLP-dependent aminotransferase family protein [Methylotenera sp.]
MKLYEQLANSIEQSIQEGVLCPGDKLPSIRQTSVSREISPSTVFQAYYLLEARGLISARERSGYFVSGQQSKTILSLPDPVVQVSEKVTQVDISELVFEVLESIKQKNVIPLGSAFPSPLLFPLNNLARTMASSVQIMDPWSSIDNLSTGDANLRRQIALRYMIDGLHVPADEIIITNGALEALNLCLAAVTRPGDTVLIESPTFYAALQSIERIGLNAIEIPSHPREGIDLDAMEMAIELHKPKVCWLMTNFQNPLGCLLSDEKKKALVALITKYKLPLIEDDVYGELYFGDKRPTPAKAYDTEGLIMHCSSFSKCLAPGYRVGWVATNRYVKDIERLKLTTALSTSTPVQAALAKYLQKGGYDRHLRSLRHTLLINQIKFTEAIARYFPEETRLTVPQGGYFLWLKLPDGVNALEVHKTAIESGISIAPGPIFSAKKEFTGYIRLNYGHIWDDRIEASLSTLGAVVRNLVPE